MFEGRSEPRLPDGPKLVGGRVPLWPRDEKLIRLLFTYPTFTRAQYAALLGISLHNMDATFTRLSQRLELGGWGELRVRLVLWALKDPRFADLRKGGA